MKQESKPNQQTKLEVSNHEAIDYKIEWFDKKTEFLVGKVEIDIDMPTMQVILDTDEFLLGGGFDIKPHHVEQLQSYTNHQIDLNRYDYQVTIE